MISIIIVSWKVNKQLHECLQSIYNYEKSIPLEIIVVDNNSGDDTDLMIKDEFPQVKYIQNKKNLGFARGCNIGAQQSQGEYLLFLNPDTSWHQEILPEIINFFEEQEDVGVVGIKLLNRCQNIQKSIRTFPTLYSQIIILSKLHKLSKNLINKYLCLSFDYEKSQKVDQVSGAFFMVKKNIYQQIGGFDEKFFIWFEEVDFCKQTKKRGFNNYYFSDVSIIHHGEESFKQVNHLKKQLIFNKSLRYYFKKNYSLAGYLTIILFTPLNLFLTTIIQLLRIKPKHYL